MLVFLPLICTNLSYKTSVSHSLLGPGVDENGRSHIVSYHDNYLVTTYLPTESPYVKLGYESADSFGGLMCKTPLDFSNFCVEVEFEVKPSSVPGMGFGIWLTKDKEYKSGSAYGRDEQIDGLLLAIDTQSKNPFIGIKLGKQTFTSNFSDVVNLKNTFYNSNIVIKLLNYANELKIYISVNKGSEQMIYSIKNSMLNSGLYYSISAKNLKGMSQTKIYSIKVSEVMHITEEKEVRKSSKFIWIVFVLACVAIGYVLYTKQVAQPKNHRA